ncbi:MAG: class I SAM-dependent methyltransferase [Coriobacteriia bacterium]|nr:class I SAM-dependent methyltransferase [Coriobacteriia bacterium]
MRRRAVQGAASRRRCGVPTAQATNTRAPGESESAKAGLVETDSENSAKLERLAHELGEVVESVHAQERVAAEVLWAQVFASTIASSGWLHDRSFAVGRWAVGFPFLYVLYRVLDEIRPSRILELGLGQSTRMVAQYAEAHPGTTHVVVENDAEWRDFFLRSFRMGDATRLVMLDCEIVAYRGSEVRVYAEFASAVAGERFDLLCIDGPLGGDMREYARVDILDIVSESLAPAFVIMFDDVERAPESRTMAETLKLLREAGIEHRSCRYSGIKDVGLICSADLRFLCSM